MIELIMAIGIDNPWWLSKAGNKHSLPSHVSIYWAVQQLARMRT